MHYVTVASHNVIDEWRVEAIDSEGRIFLTIFSGPLAQERAREYAAWKNSARKDGLHRAQ